MSKEMKKYLFNCKSNNAPAYSCNFPGDNTGAYYRAGDVAQYLEQLKTECLHAEASGKALEFVFKEQDL